MDRQHVASWLRLHSAGERSFHRTLLEYFQDQGKRVGNALRDFDVITPSVVPLIFQPEDEAELLRPIVHRHMLAMMALGASDELVTASKAADDNLPEAIRLRIRQSLEELEEQPYWRKIQDETGERLIHIIEQGLDHQDSNYRIGINIREQLGGMPANRRSQRIARTEVTGAANAGHEAAREDLYASGLVTAKQWLTIGDEDVRSDHVLLHNVTAGPREDFSVGGTDAPYPGWWGLPARQRVFCRCTTAGVLADV